MIIRLLSASSYLCSNTTAKVWFPVILPYTQVQTYSVFVFIDIISDVVGNGCKPSWTNYSIPCSPVPGRSTSYRVHTIFWYVRRVEVTCIQLICEFDSWTWNSVWSIYLIHLCKYTFLIISYSWPVCYLSRFHSTKTDCISTNVFICTTLILSPYILQCEHDRYCKLGYVKYDESPNGDWPEQIKILRHKHRYEFRI